MNGSPEKALGEVMCGSAMPLFRPASPLGVLVAQERQPDAVKLPGSSEQKGSQTNLDQIFLCPGARLGRKSIWDQPALHSVMGQGLVSEYLLFTQIHCCCFSHLLLVSPPQRPPLHTPCPS